MIARRAVLQVVTCVALVALTSGCAFVVRALVAVEALDTAHGIFESARDEESTPLAPVGTEVLATVVGTGGSGLRVNRVPGADRVGVLPDGSVVVVLCAAGGPQVTGRRGESSTWSHVRTADGTTGYMSDAYLDVAGTPGPC